MGFTGQLVFGRSDGSLLEAPVFDALRPPWGDGADEWWPRPGGWQTLQLYNHTWKPEDLQALVAWSKSPACVAEVYDSDVAQVVGLAPDGTTWRAVLNLDVAAEMGTERPEGIGDDVAWLETPQYADAVDRKRRELEAAAAVTAEAAVSWAAAAGFGPSVGRSAIKALLRSHEVFVEDLFASVVDALGFPPAVEPE